MHEFSGSNVWNFSVRMIYDRSGRTFALDFNKRYRVEVDHDGSWAFGGPAVTVEANDGVRSCIVAVGLKQFTRTFIEALTRFSRLDVTYAGDGETAHECLEDRNEFLREAALKYPALLEETSDQLRILVSEIDKARVRLASLAK